MGEFDVACDAKDIHKFCGNVESEFDSGFEVAEETDKLAKLMSDAHTVIDVPPLYLRKCSSKWLANQVSEVAHEQASIARAHFGAHW